MKSNLKQYQALRQFQIQITKAKLSKNLKKKHLSKQVKKRMKNLTEKRKHTNQLELQLLYYLL